MTRGGPRTRGTTAVLARLSPPKRTLLEEAQMLILAKFLDVLGLWWCHVPNEGRHRPQYNRKRSQLGVKAGVPDVLIFDAPPHRPGRVGLAIELKRADGEGTVQYSQKVWLEMLEKRGWEAHVCHGAQAAIDLVRACGYVLGAPAARTEKP